MTEDKTSDEDVMRKDLEKRAKLLKKKAEEKRAFGARIVKKMNEVIDTTDLVEQTAKYGSQYGDWEAMFTSFDVLESSIDDMDIIEQSYLRIEPVISTNSSSVIATGSALINRPEEEFHTKLMFSEAAKVSHSYIKFFEKYELKDEVLTLMHTRQLEGSKSGRTAIEKFKRGWEMHYLDQPNIDMSINTVIPLRQAIIFTIDELIALRPKWVRGEKIEYKILEIGDKLKYDGVSMDIFQQLQTEYKRLIKKLSRTKEELWEKDIRYELMREGTIYLRRILSAVDPTKLRKRRGINRQ